MNRNDYQSGWDTDQFPNNVPEMALAFLEVIKAGGFKTGGTNFDAKLRRQSLEPDDLLIGHIGGNGHLRPRFQGGGKNVRRQGFVCACGSPLRRLENSRSQGNAVRQAHAEEIAERVEKKNINPQPRSGRQELWKTSSTDTCDGRMR